MKRMMAMCLGSVLLVGSWSRGEEPPALMPEGPITLMSDAEPLPEPKEGKPVAEPEPVGLDTSAIYPECCPARCQARCQERKECGCWFGRVRERFSRRRSCDSCCEPPVQPAPACCQAAPTCCQPTPACCQPCDCCDRPSVMERLRNRLGGRGCRQPASCCDDCTSCGERVSFRERCRHTWDWLTYRSNDRHDCSCQEKDLTCKHPPLYTYFSCPNGNGEGVNTCGHAVPQALPTPMEQGPTMVMPR